MDYLLTLHFMTIFIISIWRFSPSFPQKTIVPPDPISDQVQSDRTELLNRQYYNIIIN